MDKRREYTVKVRDGVDVNRLNAASPVHVTLAAMQADGALLALRADQSALIGLLRYLHQHGYVLLSLNRVLESEGFMAGKENLRC